MSILKKMMANYYKISPLCWLTREKPDCTLLKLIFWHGDWCPFKRAYIDLYGEESKKGETTS
ncbi:hypothetical protein KKB18_02815 [bacterium]|nr:hypothetical protein [bacterium]